MGLRATVNFSTERLPGSSLGFQWIYRSWSGLCVCATPASYSYLLSFVNNSSNVAYFSFQFFRPPSNPLGPGTGISFSESFPRVSVYQGVLFTLSQKEQYIFVI